MHLKGGLCGSLRGRGQRGRGMEGDTRQALLVSHGNSVIFLSLWIALTKVTIACHWSCLSFTAADGGCGILGSAEDMSTFGTGEGG